MKIKTSSPTDSKSSMYKKITPETLTSPNFITPDNVNPVYAQNPSDNCRPKGSSLYPIKQPYVDYGNWKGVDVGERTCDIIKFNEPP